MSLVADRSYDTSCRITSTATAIEAARVLAHQDKLDGCEWKCVLYLNAQHDVIGHTIYTTTVHPCSISLDVASVVADARANPIRPTILLTVRSHPHEGILPLAKTLNWVTALQAVSLDSKMVLHDHIVLFGNEYQFSVRDRGAGLLAIGLASGLKFLPAVGLAHELMPLLAQ